MKSRWPDSRYQNGARRPLTGPGPCGKMTFVSRADAKRAAKALRASGRERRDEGEARLEEYPCSKCMQWHIGHARMRYLVPVEGQPGV